MNSVQESKNELDAAIRYAENAISSAKQTIESMEFRQQMAQKNHQEQTGREQALERDLTVKTSQAEAWRKEYEKAKKEADELRDKVQGQYDDIVMMEKNVKYLRDESERLKREKEASSGPCGCQAYRDLEEKVATMPVIPKDVAIAIFREGVQSGINDAVAELEGQSINISENDYVGDFSITFERDIHLDDELDLDWMRDKVGQYEESFVVDALKGLCASKEFECRIHGIDDQQTKDND